MKVKIKICGIRSLKAAKTAVFAGADFLGFNFVSTSKRYIDPSHALEIINSVRRKVKIVGVFQNAEKFSWLDPYKRRESVPSDPIAFLTCRNSR